MTRPANGVERLPWSDRPLAKVRVRDTPGLPPAGQVAPHGGVERSEFFGRLRIPMQNGTGKPEGKR